MPKIANKKPGPAPGMKPDFTGVPGELVTASGLEHLCFGRHTRTSPYDALLHQLAEAKPGSLLRFGAGRAQASVQLRARKLGMRVSFARDGASLYVRFDGRVADDQKATRRTAILGVLRLAPATAIKLAGVLRTKGDEHVDASLVESICGQMLKSGELIKREGGEWALNPSRKAA